MRSFTDSRGRTWEITVDYDAIVRIRARVGLDLLNPRDPRNDGDDDFTAKLLGVVCVLCERQCAERGLSEEDFVRAMAEGGLTNAWQAYQLAFWDWFWLRGLVEAEA